MSSHKGSQVKPNPEYGSGVFRRRILLSRPSTNQIEAKLEDCNHGFSINLEHDGKKITAIKANAHRHPFNTCPAAIDALQQFVSCPLQADASTVRKTAKPDKNCTHLYDLVTLAMAHAKRPESQRLYDVTVPDEVDGVLTVKVSCDGNELHNWQIKNKHIIAPEHLAGKPMMKGFYHWATSEFKDDRSGDMMEAADVLQRGFFVSHTRRLDLKNSAGRPATGDHMPDGSCHTYNADVVENAFQVEEAIRDFTESPELLLKFV